MQYPEDLVPLKLYSKPLKLPVNFENRKHGSLVMLLTPNTHFIDKMMDLPYIVNNGAFESYYVEKNITLLINTDKK